MRSRTGILLALGIVMSLPAFAQTDQDESMADVPAQNTADMTVPPPASDTPYATEVGAERRENYIKLGLTTSGGYIRNLYPGTTGQNINEAIYLIQPAFDIDRSTSRLQSKVSYAPSFGWYQVPKVVNTTDHKVLGNLTYRLSPHITFLASESFDKSATAFGQTTPTFQPTIGGSNQFNAAQIYGVFEPQITNRSETGVNWQFARNDMLTGSGWVNTVHFTNSGEAGGLYNTTASAGSGSWSHRLTLGQYIGGIYQYAWAQANPVTATELGSSTTTSDNLLGFYTAYLQPRLSVSLEGGGEHYRLKQPGFPDYRGWSPNGTASMAWQGDHTNFAVSYAHQFSAAAGVLDAFVTSNAAVSGRWQLTRTWTAQINGMYTIVSNVASKTWPSAIGRGHSVSGGANIAYRITPLLQLSGNYDRIHQSYRNIPSIAANPDSDRILFSLTYSLLHPIGR